MTHIGSRIAVTVFFALLYLGFAVETGVLLYEFAPEHLAIPMATMFAHNFLFFPVAGLLALIAFWRPAVMLVDALGTGKLRHGWITLGLVIAAIGALAYILSSAFAASNTRSLFEISPQAIAADESRESDDDALRRASVREVLLQLHIMADIDGGLQQFQSRCEEDWLRFGVTADQEKQCFPTGTKTSIAACCTARTDFRDHVNTLQADSPSLLAGVHRAVLPLKMVFLLTLLFIGILLVWLRK
ncbi:MAG: hypothetical protein RLN72_06675, partial [Henriciella sp.]